MPSASGCLFRPPANEVAARFGLLHAARLPELYRETFKNDLSRFNGDPSCTVPTPGRYLVGTDGVVPYTELETH
jgi:hypothetical protein